MLYLLAPMHPIFLQIEPGDVVAVQPPQKQPFVGQVLYVDGGACAYHPNYAQVIREEDMAIISINPDWVVDRVPGAGRITA